MLFKRTTVFLLSFTLTGCLVSPKPMTSSEVVKRIASDLHHMFDHQEPITRPITISEAIARALKYNLDIRLKAMESVFKYKHMHVSQYDMLPDIVAEAGFIGRNNDYSIKSSQNKSLTSISQDRHRDIKNVKFSWNILDFGISYFTAKQAANDYLAVAERHRKMVQNVVTDIRYAFWRAVSAQKLLREIKPIYKEIDGAIRDAQSIYKQNIKPRLDVLRYIKSLYEKKQQLLIMQRDLIFAKKELASFMNVHPNIDYTVVEPNKVKDVLPEYLPKDVVTLEKIALKSRPELKEADYETRIANDQIIKSRISMMPGLAIDKAAEYDSNSFLVNSSWLSYAVKVTWNLIDLISGPSTVMEAKAGKKVKELNRQALTMAVLTQVEIAYLRYHQTRKEISLGDDISRIEKQIYAQITKETEADKRNRLDLIQSKMSYLISQLRYDINYAEYQYSAAQLLLSVGHDPFDNLDLSQSITDLSQAVMSRLLEYDRSDDYVK